MSEDPDSEHHTARWRRVRIPDTLRPPPKPQHTGGEALSARGKPKPQLPVSDHVQLIALEPRLLRRAVVLLLVILTLYQLALWLFGATGHFLFLILLAWLGAIAMEPAIRWFERRGTSRAIGTSITMFIGVILFGTVIVMFGGVFSAQIAQLARSLPNIINEVVLWVNGQFDLNINPNEIIQQFNLDANIIANFASDFAGGIVEAFGSVFAVVFDLLTVLVFSWYLAADSPRLRRTIASWLPPKRQRVMLKVWDISLAKAGGFVASKLILALISAVAHAAFFWFIDLPYWLPMGVFAGFTAQLIPIIGTYLGVAAPLVISLTDQPTDGIWIIVFATIYQQIENYYLTPRVSRATMNIHPAVALGAVFAGIAIWGPIGALIGIPIAAAIIAVLYTYGERYEIIAEMSEEPTSDQMEASTTDDQDLSKQQPDQDTVTVGRSRDLGSD